MKAKNIHRFPRFEAFREAVDVALSQSAHPDGLYKIEAETFEGIQAIFAETANEVLKTTRPLNDDIGSELVAIRKEIILSRMLAGSAEDPYYEIADFLRFAFKKNKLIPTISSDDERWIQALHIAQTHLDRRDFIKAPVPAGLKAQEITFAQAIHFFNAKGIKVPLVGDDIIFDSKKDWAAVAATVSKLLEPLGDVQVMQYLANWLAPKFELTIQRMHLHPTPDNMGRKLDRSLPYGHLYRLAIKMLGRRRVVGRKGGTLQSIGETAKHFAALYEVEPFSVYETMFPPYPGKIVEVLKRIVQYDELFSIPQCDPMSMERLLRDLFEDISGTGHIGQTGWSFNNILALWTLLLSIVPRTGVSTFISQAQFRQLLTQRVGRSACDALLASFVLASPNRYYSTPADAVRSDTRECVIAVASGDRYWIAPRPFIGPAFFARLVTLYAREQKGISQKIGDAFEARMLQRVRALGVSCRRVEVVGSKGANAGEIDLLIETDKVVGLFELKKKGLTRKTNAGDDLKLLADLSRGLVHGVNQLTKHELTLYREGQLTFSDGTTLSLDQRDVLKGVISLADHGGLHDGAILRNALNSFSQVTFNSNQTLTVEQQADLDEVKREVSTLQKRAMEFAQLVPQEPDRPARTLFDNLVFHNVFFVEHVLLSLKTAEDFLTRLRMLSRIVTGSRDSIFDIERFNTSPKS
ncbi:MAG: hypothetical protein EPN73_07425 [Paraburkholderia sp.]|uniref:hypothetical protein n=1 Tax=Paraburkholderia sp. TaxID=1926495 RepID=UPI001216F9E2|nr:hypothetical protein [Paraburkholderia sp.]TAL97060.1 MAG: hypothetical protein EPN73_07425 [Paraburkholderia sp.]